MLEIWGCWEPRAPSNSPVASLNFSEEPKNVLVSIQNTFWQLLKMQLGFPKKTTLNFEPWEVLGFRDVICVQNKVILFYVLGTRTIEDPQHRNFQTSEAVSILQLLTTSRDFAMICPACLLDRHFPDKLLLRRTHISMKNLQL